MTKTTNYQLNQWDATDRVLRTDFNSDNQKIDAAIAEVRAENPLAVLRVLTATQTANQTLDLSWADWEAYREIHIYFDLNFSSTEVRGTILLNNKSGSSDYLLSSSNTQSSLGGFNTSHAKRFTCLLRLMPGGSGILGSMDYVGMYPGHSQAVCQAVSADTLETVNINLSEAPAAGSYVFYGLLR